MSDDSIFADGTPRTAVPHTLGSGYPPLRWQASPGRGSDGGEVIPSRRDLSLSLASSTRSKSSENYHEISKVALQRRQRSGQLLFRRRILAKQRRLRKLNHHRFGTLPAWRN